MVLGPSVGELFPGRGRSLWPVWLLSAAIHAALIVAWLNQTTPGMAQQPPRMSVRIVPLLPSVPGVAAPAPSVPPAPMRRPELAADVEPARKPVQRTPPAPSARNAPAASVDASHPPEVPSDLQFTAPPAQPPAPDATAAVGAPPVAAPQQPLRPSPSPAGGSLRLDLPMPSRAGRGLPSPSVRDQALNDPRTNALRSASEARAAADPGDGRLHEEALGDGRRRLRMGSACVDVHRTHIAQLNPFDARLRDLNVAKPCD